MARSQELVVSDQPSVVRDESLVETVTESSCALLTTDLVRTTLRNLLAATQECVLAEEESQRQFSEATVAAQNAYQQAHSETQQAWDAEKATLTEEFQERRQTLQSACEAETAAVEKEYASTSSEIVLQYERDEAATTKEYQESGWTLEAIYDAHKKQAKEKLEATKRMAADQCSAAATIRESVASRFHEWNQSSANFDEAAQSVPSDADPRKRIAEAREWAARLDRLRAPRILIGERILLIGIALSILLAGLLGWAGPSLFAVEKILAVGFGALLGLALGALVTFALRFLVIKRAAHGIATVCGPLYRALSEAETRCEQLVVAEDKMYRESKTSAKEKLKAEKRLGEKSHRQNLAAALQRRDTDARAAAAKRDAGMLVVAEKRQREFAAIDADEKSRFANLNSKFGGALQRTEEILKRESEQAQREFDDTFQRLSAKWHQRFDVINASLQSIREQNSRLFPDWSSGEWSSWQPPKSVPPSMRFGSMQVTLPALPRDERLTKPPAQLKLPALLPFPNQGATLLHASGAAKTAGAHALLAMATRFLTSLPAGKVRLTIIDPVNLGESFAALMRLADDDPQLVGARIWTEQPQIEKRLSDMTAHMENVIQKYLRNQYASIEEYNAQAGEVAEPYRVLVVANFPANFSSEAARRLERIATSGASCGVYTLVSYDSSLPLPQGFDTADLIRASLNLRWRDSRFAWDDSDFGAWPLAVDQPPQQSVLNEALDRVGKAAKDANRVEVDFSFIAPPTNSRWLGDSRGGIDVALGRAGATKRQHLRLGQGTAQHVVVAGKTGSGKSTLLHALITNLALTYGPEEVELYLIDFKKGVEFKTYATHQLPHARVIAVESEREFGLSVLQRLDTELKRRGEMYRQAGAQDVKGFREQDPQTKMPRILLIVDEFQEFFVEDDRVAQEAALLLDRLVRQGRAFGLHVLLGSQTLGGAYSLARSTIDQMAVRVALQCSEADAGLILSKDNNAARLLSRPGEAIYNDANGLIEGNDIFQVVWLPEDRREVYLTEVRAAADKAGYRPPAPTVVFEGNVPSDMTTDDWFTGVLRDGPARVQPRELACRLGDAMAIKAPTTAVFRRQSASNLLVLGQQPEPARALTVALMIAALGQQPVATDSRPRVVLVDGTPADDLHAGYFADKLSGFPGLCVVPGRDAAAAVETVWAEYEQRTADQSQVAPALLLVIYGLHRIKDLRKAEDDFGFKRGDGANPAQRFATILREGSAVGIHIVAWCDTLMNAQRSFERAALREFEMKVLFQMSANDSSTLIDSPHASRLGVNRALFAHEELTAPEKFRPYTLPPDEWISEVRKKLA